MTDQEKYQEDLKAAQDKMFALEQQAVKEREDRIRAEAEASAYKEAVKFRQEQQQPQTVSEEQKKALEEKYGVSYDQLQATAAIVDAQGKQLQATFEQEKKAILEKQRELEEKLNRQEAEKNFSYVKNDFYEANPALKRHSKDIEEFTNMFSESDRKDPKKMKDILEKAKTYVKGKVGGEKQVTRSEGGSSRFERSQDNVDEETVEVDTTGLKADEAQTVQGIRHTKEEVELYKKHAFEDGKREGVAIASRDEWKTARETVLKKR